MYLITNQSCLFQLFWRGSHHPISVVNMVRMVVVLYEQVPGTERNSHHLTGVFSFYKIVLYRIWQICSLLCI